MRVVGPRKCLLVLNAFCLLFVVCFLYLGPGVSLVRTDSLLSWTKSSDSDSNASVHVSYNSTDDDDDDEDSCVRDFLSDYRKYCEARLVNSSRFQLRNSSEPCPCISDDLVGRVSVNETVPPSLDELELDIGSLRENGRWRPPGCVAWQRLAIIIPYADRERHLRIFLNHMHPFLQRQLIDYSIFVIEQLYPGLFNRAMLMNVGFVEANSTDDFDCFIFHDIDQLPIDDRNFYTCSSDPRHVVGYRKKFNYNYAYSTSFGGGNSFTRQQFETINGYSNSFYGWGGEDDDLYQRTEAKKMPRTRYPRCIAKYDEVKHERDKRNPLGVNQQLGFKFRPDVYEKDGLNSLNYTVLSIESRRLFTKISVSLPDPPPTDSANQIFGFFNFLARLVRLLIGGQDVESL